MFPFTPAATVQDQPCVTLRHWRVFEQPTGERHLVGLVVATGRARVSTALAQFDARTLRATTGSGRAYRLDGQPDETGTSQYVWSWWAILNNWVGARDVTQSVLAAHRRSPN